MYLMFQGQENIIAQSLLNCSEDKPPLYIFRLSSEGEWKMFRRICYMLFLPPTLPVTLKLAESEEPSGNMW